MLSHMMCLCLFKGQEFSGSQNIEWTSIHRIERFKTSSSTIEISNKKYQIKSLTG